MHGVNLLFIIFRLVSGYVKDTTKRKGSFEVYSLILNCDPREHKEEQGRKGQRHPNGKV